MTSAETRPGPPVGRRVAVTVAASSANLGPGFDCLALALDWRDETTVTVTADGFGAVVTGHGSGLVPTDEEHLVVSCVRRGLADLDVAVPGLEVRSHNTIPHGRGLGSSSAAIVSGLAAAWGLARPGEPLDRGWALPLATAIEGHPDNVAAAVHGGLVLAYRDDERAGGDDRAQAVAVAVHPDVEGVLYVPDTALSTRLARGLLPANVPHADAAAGAGRAALLVHALREAPDLLLPATRDWLHQSYRADAAPASAALVTALRQQGRAAVISGAGPTVLVLGRRAALADLADVDGFERRRVGVGGGAAVGATLGSPR